MDKTQFRSEDDNNTSGIIHLRGPSRQRRVIIHKN